MNRTFYSKVSNETYLCHESWPDKISLIFWPLGMISCIIWIPSVILIMTQVMMYNRMKHSTVIHSTSTEQDRFLQLELSRAFKTFSTILFVFAICIIPYAIQLHIMTFLIAYKAMFLLRNKDLIYSINNGIYILMSTNCIWNAAIYGKIHRHVLKICKSSNGREDSSFCLSERNRASTSQSTTTNITIVRDKNE